MMFAKHMHAPLRINPFDFNDPMTFRSSVQTLHCTPIIDKANLELQMWLSAIPRANIVLAVVCQQTSHLLCTDASLNFAMESIRYCLPCSG